MNRKRWIIYGGICCLFLITLTGSFFAYQRMDRHIIEWQDEYPSRPSPLFYGAYDRCLSGMYGERESSDAYSVLFDINDTYEEELSDIVDNALEIPGKEVDEIVSTLVRFWRYVWRSLNICNIHDSYEIVDKQLLENAQEDSLVIELFEQYEPTVNFFEQTDILQKHLELWRPFLEFQKKYEGDSVALVNIPKVRFELGDKTADNPLFQRTRSDTSHIMFMMNRNPEIIYIQTTDQEKVVLLEQETNISTMKLNPTTTPDSATTANYRSIRYAPISEVPIITCDATPLQAYLKQQNREEITLELVANGDAAGSKAAMRTQRFVYRGESAIVVQPWNERLRTLVWW